MLRVSTIEKTFSYSKDLYMKINSVMDVEALLDDKEDYDSNASSDIAIDDHSDDDDQINASSPSEIENDDNGTDIDDGNLCHLDNMSVIDKTSQDSNWNSNRFVTKSTEYPLLYQIRPNTFAIHYNLIIQNLHVNIFYPVKKDQLEFFVNDDIDEDMVTALDDLYKVLKNFKYWF